MLVRVSRHALLCAGLGLAATPAFAIEADDFAAKFEALSAAMGISVATEDATVEGDTVTLSNFTLSFAGTDPVALPGDLVFEGVIETENGGYTAQRAWISDIDTEIDAEHEGDGPQSAHLVVRNIEMEGLTIPAEIALEDDIETLMNASFYDRISAGPFSVAVDGTEVVTLESVEAWMDPDSQADTILSGFSLTGLSVALSEIEEPEAQEVFETLELETLGFDMAAEASWNFATGVMAVEDATLTFEDLGSLSFSGAVTGYTEAFYRDIMKINRKLAEMSADQTIPDEQMDAYTEATLAKMAELKLARASLRYDDASLFMKVVDLAAAEQGTDGATLLQGIKFSVPMMLMEVDNPPFVTMISTALNAFIDAPGNIAVSAAPDEPVGVDVMMAAEEDPMVLIDLLNVQVTANQ